MALMSFAHLKNKKSTGKVIPAASPSLEKPAAKKAAGGVMSFAHLKGRKPQAAVPKKQPAATLEAKPEKTQPRVWRIPVVMKTARLMAVNYCGGWPRFLTASDWEKKEVIHTDGVAGRESLITISGTPERKPRYVAVAEIGLGNLNSSASFLALTGLEMHRKHIK